MPSPNLFGKLGNPFPSILSDLLELDGPQSFGFRGSNLDGDQFGTVTGARRNFKPFIIGFLPPDVPVNFVPFDRKETTLSGISVVQVNDDTSPRGFRNIPIPSDIPSYASGPAKKVARQRTVFSGQDLRVSIARGYQQVIGTTPTEDQVALIYSQMVAELSRTSSKKGESFSTFNFNVGNSHTGTPGRFDPGPNGPWMGTLAPGESPQPGKTGPPPNFEQSISSSAPVVGAGRHYVFYDSDINKDGVPVWYPTAYRAFDNLQDGMNHHISLLARKYPNALKATDASSYEAGLMDFESKYHSVNAKDPDFYEKNLERGIANYKKLYGNSPLGGDLTISGDPVDSNVPPKSNTSDTIRASIMTTGGFSAVQDDKLSDSIGRSAVLATNSERVDVVKRQTDNLRRQIEKMATIPPLILLINPTEFNRQYQQNTDSSAATRSGRIVQTWIERPGVLTSSGVTAAQYVVDAEGSGGLTTEKRVYSLSYQNLLSLVGIYKNNGIIYSNSGRDGNGQGVPILTSSVFIYYDNNIYIGSFDTMSVIDDANKPHNMSYEFAFNVRYEESVDGLNFFDSNIANTALPLGRI